MPPESRWSLISRILSLTNVKDRLGSFPGCHQVKSFTSSWYQQRPCAREATKVNGWNTKVRPCAQGPKLSWFWLINGSMANSMSAHIPFFPLVPLLTSHLKNPAAQRQILPLMAMTCTVDLADLQLNHIIRKSPGSSSFESVAFSKGGNSFALGEANGTISVSNIPLMALKLTLILCIRLANPIPSKLSESST